MAAACGELLAGRTKDLRLAMWMTEAWAMLDGFQGLARGLRLCALLSERYWHDRMFTVVGHLRSIAADTGVSPATLAMQWVLANPVITSPIVGASNPSQLSDAVTAIDRPIDPVVKERLDELTADFRHGDSPR